MKKLLILFTILSSFLATQAQEKHLTNLKQLTFGGDNAEAYFSPNGKYLSFQSNNKKWGLECDQIFKLDIAKASADSNYFPLRISNGLGRTTCGAIMMILIFLFRVKRVKLKSN